LPQRDDRHWALGLAIEVAFADRELHPTEVDDIADLADALGLTDDDVLDAERRRSIIRRQTQAL
jgi:uncharacterized tellurite resistance protein B-like protein